MAMRGRRGIAGARRHRGSCSRGRPPRISGSAAVPGTKDRCGAHITDGQSAVGISLLLRGQSELLGERELKPLTGCNQYRGQEGCLNLHCVRKWPQDNSTVSSGFRRPSSGLSWHRAGFVVVHICPKAMLSPDALAGCHRRQTQIGSQKSERR
jgi:hypothetical protein